MRVALLVSMVLVGCGHTEKPEVHSPPPPPVAAPAPEKPPAPCAVKTRVVSLPGRGGVRPDVASNGNAFAVVWEETDESHRGIHFLAFDGDANPAGPSVEVADLERGGAEPRVAPAGDGFLVVWTVDQPDTSQIVVRRVDARGKPLGDAMTAVSSANARPLAVSQAGDGFALAWWTWSAEPPAQNVTFLDGTGKPRGKAVALARGQLVEPNVDFLSAGDIVRATWIESVEATDHVFSGQLSRAGVSARVDVGPGDDPSIVDDGVVFANLTEGSVYLARPGEAKPVRIGKGQSPDADGKTVCMSHVADTGDQPDTLGCLTLAGGRAGREHPVLSAAGGVLTLRIARASDVVGLVYQTEATDGMAVTFAAARCPE